MQSRSFFLQYYRNAKEKYAWILCSRILCSRIETFTKCAGILCSWNFFWKNFFCNNICIWHRFILFFIKILLKELLFCNKLWILTWIYFVFDKNSFERSFWNNIEPLHYFFFFMKLLLKEVFFCNNICIWHRFILVFIKILLKDVFAIIEISLEILTNIII